jgi:GNAT superfamily N-acetyltransferase
MLRLATPSDRDAVYEIYMHPQVVPYLGYDPMSCEDFAPVFQELLECRSFYVLEREGSVAGFCRVTRQPGRASHVAYLGTLAVAPRWHGTGVARELMERIIAMLRAQGVLRVELMLDRQSTSSGVLPQARIRAGRHHARGVQTRQRPPLHRRDLHGPAAG